MARAKEPTLSREQQKDAAVASYARHGILSIAAAGAGISVDTLSQWAKADPEFQERLTRAKLEKAHQYLEQLDTTRDHKQMRWWLATMLPQHFAAKQQIELTGAGGGPIQVQSLAVVVAGNDAARGAYHGLLAALAGTDRDGEPRRVAVGGDKGQPDAVAALPAQPRARQRAARRLEAAKT